MISKKELVRINKNSDFNLYQQEKEYLLKLFLFFYYKRFDDAIFKGGTCLRLTQDLNRFSEDLDFNIKNPKEFKKQIKEVLKDLKKTGISNKIKKEEAFKDAYTYTISFKGPLFQDTKINNNIRIDAGYREGTFLDPEWKIINSEYADTKNKFLVKTMNIKEILCEKINTLFNRKKGRDLYDVWFLLESGITLNRKLIKNKVRKRKDIVSQKDYEKDIKHLTKKIIPYQQAKNRLQTYLSNLK